MPQYYFHVIGQLEVEDDEGEEFSDAESAVLQALRMASELAEDRGNYHGCLFA